LPWKKSKIIFLAYSQDLVRLFKSNAFFAKDSVWQRISAIPPGKQKACKHSVLQAFQQIDNRVSGEGGIRTLGTVARTTVFETATIDRSATSPNGLTMSVVGRGAKVRILGHIFAFGIGFGLVRGRFWVRLGEMR
jgi:hypothetical protein